MTTAADVGLGNVDNTSDADKPVSTATATALADKVDKSSFSSFGTGLVSLTNSVSMLSYLGFGTTAQVNVPTSGNAATNQAVLGNDTRLSDARTPTSHTQAWSTITATPTTVAGYGITDAASLSNLSGTSNNSQGAGLVGYSASITYSASTVGVKLSLLPQPQDSSSTVDATSFALGTSAGSALTTGGTGNTAVGYQSQITTSTGICNSSYGYRTLSANTTGNYSTSIGGNNQYFANGLGFNTTVGYGCGYNLTTGYSNVAMGFESLHDCQAGTANCAIGYASQHYGLANGGSRDPHSVTALGTYALQFNQADSTIGIGYSTLKSNTGSGNVGVGDNCAINNTSGSSGTYLGSSAAANKTTGVNDTMIGFQAGLTQTTSAGYNTYIGSLAGYYNTTAAQNTFVGFQAGGGTTSVNGGGSNVAVGYGAMQLCGAVSQVVAVGQLAFRNVSTGTNNVGLGTNAGVLVTTGSNIVAVGTNALNTETTGTYLTAIGDSAGASQTTGLTNTTALGAGANCNASNQITLGNSSVTALRCQVTTITSLSDIRDKDLKGQLDVPDEFLDVVLTPWVYEWAMRDGTLREDGLQVGVIAQYLKSAQDQFGLQWLRLVDESNPDRLEATPGKLLYLIALRAQRQQVMLNDLMKRIQVLENKG